MKNNLKFWAVDVFTFASQLILGIAAMIYGLVSNHEFFIPSGIALVSGGIGSLSSLIAYIKRQKNAQPEMFDERADLISSKAASVSFKVTFVALEAALLVSMLPYKMPYYILPFCIGSIMSISFVSYMLARGFYGQRY